MLKKNFKSWALLGCIMHQAAEELQQAEAFFNQADARQLDYANAWLTAARLKVDMLLKQAKLEVS